MQKGFSFICKFIFSDTLSVRANGTGVLHSGAIWGALRGLETFSHMFFTLDQTNVNINCSFLLPAALQIYDCFQWQLRTGEITDYPRFAHRGILLDTSRHYLSIGNIKKNLVRTFLIDRLTSFLKQTKLLWTF